MTRRRAALAIALAVAVAGCIPTTTQTPPSPAGSGQAAPSSTGPSPSRAPRTPAPTAATILALSTGQRPSGPWAVAFQHPGEDAVREVYVLTSACPEAACDLTATVQTFAGEPLGSAVFTYVDGMYRYEADREAPIACNDGVAVVPDGATALSHTTLLIAGYRAAGTAVVSVGIRGTRTVRITPTADSTCAAAELDYTANGEKTEFAAAPTPTPRPTANPQVPKIAASFFGSGATVSTYRITGGSISEIVSSIRQNGPWSDWIHARAEAVTRAVPAYRFDREQAGDQCRVHVAATPAVSFSYAITLPAWARPKSADAATVRWWAGAIQRVATHERHHVEIYRDGAVRMTDAVVHGTCATLPGRLAAIVKDVDTQQCEFDLKEYGAALGLSLSSCLSQ